MYPTKNRRVTLRYGVKRARYAAGVHTGTDFGAKVPGKPGDLIRVTYAGTVVSIDNTDDYGLRVVVRHVVAGRVRFSHYCHLSRLHKRARVGRKLHTGDVIAYMGASGNVTATHLHYEERDASNTYRGHLDPVLFAKRAPLRLRAAGYR